MEHDEPDLSIIMVTYNGRDMALQTLGSAMSSVGDIDVEWLVVDNGSHDGVADVIEDTFPAVRVFRHFNAGFAAGNNVALAEARGRHVLLLNPDISVTHGAFEDLVRALDSAPEVGAASVVQLTPEGTFQRSIRRDPGPLRTLGEALFAFHWPFLRSLQEAEMRDYLYERPHDADWLVGAFLAVRRDALEQVGPLDERFFMYAEEADWCLRIRSCGWSVRHLPVMRVIHFGADRPRPELMAQLTHSRILYGRKHFGFLKRSADRAMFVLGHSLRVALFGVLAQWRPAYALRGQGERLALKVSLGLAPPPFKPVQRGAIAPTREVVGS
jgi:GT2 family glycosyltransferase